MYPATSARQSLENSPHNVRNPYESDRALQEYLLFHYGSSGEVLPYPWGPHDALGFAQRCVSQCVQFHRLNERSRALDLGCAVGRSSYELARGCGEVLGIDYSGRFIAAAECIRSAGLLNYDAVEEGNRMTARVARRPEGVDFERIRFERGDAMALRADLGRFDVVLMANLIDRLSDPQKCLRSLSPLLGPGGQLVITSPYTWMEEYTPRERWLCEDDARGACSSLDGIKRVLEGDFDLIQTIDLPFLIREHSRKFQWSVAQASCWSRKA